MAIPKNKSNSQVQGTMNVLGPAQVNQEEDNQAPATMNQTTQQGTVIGSTAQAPKAPTGSSGQFQNVKAYLAANKGGGASAAQAVKNNVVGKATDAVGAVNTTQEAIAGQIEENKKAIGANITNAKNALNSAGMPQQTYKIQPYPAPVDDGTRRLQQQESNSLGETPITDPAIVKSSVGLASANSPITADQFATYTKEADANTQAYAAQKAAFETAAADAANEQARLAAQAEAAKTEQGRQDLLYSTFGQKGRYSTGMSKLDQLLMQGEGQAQNISTDVAAEANRVAEANRIAQENLAAKQADYANAQALLTGQGEGSLRDIIGKQYTGIDADLQNRIRTYADTQAKNEIAMQDFLTNPNSKVDIKTLGLSPSDTKLLSDMRASGSGARQETEEEFKNRLAGDFGMRDKELAQKMWEDNVYNKSKIEDVINPSFKATSDIDPTTQKNLFALSDATRFATQKDRDRYAALNALVGENLKGTSRVLDADLSQDAIDASKQSLKDMGLINSSGMTQLPDANLFKMDSAYTKAAKQNVDNMLNNWLIPPNTEGGKLLSDIMINKPGAALTPDNINIIMGNSVNSDRGVDPTTKSMMANAINKGNADEFLKAKEVAASKTIETLKNQIQANEGYGREDLDKAFSPANIAKWKATGEIPNMRQRKQGSDPETPIYEMVPDSRFIALTQRLGELEQTSRKAFNLIDKKQQNIKLQDFLMGRK